MLNRVFRVNLSHQLVVLHLLVSLLYPAVSSQPLTQWSAEFLAWRGSRRKCFAPRHSGRAGGGRDYRQQWLLGRVGWMKWTMLRQHCGRPGDEEIRNLTGLTCFQLFMRLALPKIVPCCISETPIKTSATNSRSKANFSFQFIATAMCGTVWRTWQVTSCWG